MYKIIEIRPTEGLLQYVHSTIINRECEIVEATVGKRGMLRVDVGDDIIGPHRILLSIIKSVSEGTDEPTITIETEHSIYVLEKIDKPEKGEFVPSP